MKLFPKLGAALVMVTIIHGNIIASAIDGKGQKQNIEVIIEGKKYNSLKEYKDRQLSGNKEEKTRLNLAGLIDSSIEEHGGSKEYYAKDEVRSILHDFYVQLFEIKGEGVKDDSLSESINEMIEEYENTNNHELDINIDFQKMKTWTIQPQN